MRTRVIAGALVVVASLGTASLVRPSYGGPTQQAPFRARVIGIYDGDTILIRPHGQSRWQQIRLYGIDAPEYDPPRVQRFGYESFAHVYRETLGEDVIVRPIVRDFYGRIVAEVHLADGRLLQTELLDRGLAWVYRSFIWGSRRYEWLDREAVARQARRGLWQDQSPMAPWQWRDIYY